MKILVVEDEEILIKVLREKLEREKFSVEVAVDGDSVLAVAKRFRPDLVLLDLILPKKDGFQVLEELKADPDVSMIPVIVISNLADDEKIKNAFRLGAIDYLVKTQHPINEVVEKIKEHALKAK